MALLKTVRAKIGRPGLAKLKTGKARPGMAGAGRTPAVRTYLMGGATLACALSIGYIMQYGSGSVEPPPGAADGVVVTQITNTSSSASPPRPPSEIKLESALPEKPVELAAAGDSDAGIEEDLDTLPQEQADSGFACEVTMDAVPAAGAMVDVTLRSPCHASERVTIHHNGLMFTQMLQPDGTLSVTVPALAEQANFIAAFASGDGASAVTEVTSLEFYDRVAVQWKGQAGLQLHAREFDADYFTDGHVWAAASGDLAEAARGEGGFLTRLGRADAPAALMAEVYSFPTGTARSGGAIALSVEAEVTDLNCDQTIAAQTFEKHAEGELRVRDMTLEMPGCDSVGDFLVLKNLVEDLKVAAR